MTSVSSKRKPAGILAWCVLLAVFVLVAVIAARRGRTSDAPRIGGLWESRGFAVVVATGLFVFGAGLILSAGPPQRRRRALGLCAAILVLGGMFALLELCAVFRLVDYRLVFPTHSIRPRENPRNVLDFELLYRHPPHERFVGSVPGDLTAGYAIPTDRQYAVDFRYDHRGFRNREDRERADIVLIGDSKVEGSLVSYEQISSSRLETMLQVPVLNLGQVGYGPQQCAIVLRRFGLPAQPKVIVWVLFEGNDLTLDFKRYQRSMADFDDYVRQMHGLQVRSFTRNLFLVLARWSTPPSSESTLRGRDRSCLLTSGPEAGERLYFAYKPLELTPESGVQLHAPLQSVLEGHRACESAGIQFLVLFVPIKYRVYHDLCVIEPGTEAAGWTLHDVPGFIADWAREHHITLIDLTPDLRSRAAAGDLVYYLDDSHWSSVGHEVAAVKIADVIRERQWLKGSDPAE